MAQDASSKPKRGQPPLVDDLLQYGQWAFNPELPEETRNPNQVKFRSLIESTGNLALIPALNLLVQPGRTEPWLRAPLISALATLPLRKRGVQDTIEFILSVHPSSAGYNTETNAGKGAGMTLEALGAASKLLSTPPVGLSPDDWFSGIAPQLFSLLQGEGEPEMDRAAAFVIGFGILGRKAYGAPGSAGWKAFVEPIISRVDPALVSHGHSSDEEIIILGSRVLASSSDLAKSLQKLTSLVTIHPHPSLTKRLLRPLLLPLWTISSWPDGNEFTENSFRKPARKLLKFLLQLSCSVKPSDQSPTLEYKTSDLGTIVNNLLFKGKSIKPREQWKYMTCSNGGIQIQQFSDEDSRSHSETDMAAIDNAADSLISFIEEMPEMDSDVSQLFLELCKKWLAVSQMDRTPSVLIRVESRESHKDMENRLIEAKVMQKMMTSIPGKLVNNSRQVLDLVNKILSGLDHTEQGKEDVASIALSLLNLVLGSPNFQETPETEIFMEEIKTSLASIAKRPDLNIANTAQNLLMLLKFRKDIDDPEVTAKFTTDQQSEDRKTYSLALSYLTSVESPPPVRVQGLELMSGLIRVSSPVLDIPSVVVLLSSLLQDGDEYIYLRVIKSFIELSQKHPKAAMKDLIDRYVDANEDSELDRRLRFGEALLQVIQNSSSSFSGDTARTVCEGLLSIASRRGHRPKTEKEQEKKNRLKRKKNQEAEDAWDGVVPQIEEDLTPENEILSQIVSGWESKRGTEDVRVRASALSILGYAIEANVVEVGSALISASVDLSIHVLTLELEPEKGILRRAAILLIMSFVRALDAARREGKKLAFGFVGQSLHDVQRILKYVVETDNDGLVQQHANDVIEGLQTWQMNSLLPLINEQTEVEQLAGLSIRPIGQGTSRIGGRPKIEEIE